MWIQRASKFCIIESIALKEEDDQRIVKSLAIKKKKYSNHRYFWNSIIASFDFEHLKLIIQGDGHDQGWDMDEIFFILLQRKITSSEQNLKLVWLVVMMTKHFGGK